MKKILFSGLVSGLVMLIVGMALNFVWHGLFPSLVVEYQNPMFRPWSDPLMSLIFVAPILSGFFMAWIWNMFKNYHMFSTGKKVLTFSGSLIILSVIGMLMTYSTFNMSLLMLATWTFGGATQYYLGTWVLAKMNK